MKNFLSLLLLVVIVQTSFSQEKVRIKEAGASFSNLNNFGFIFRTGTQNSLWLINSNFASGENLNLTNQDGSNLQFTGYTIGIGIGKEYRKDLIENLQFRYGAQIYSSYGTTTQITKHTVGDTYTRESNSIYTGLRFILGVNYVLKEKIILGAEIWPVGISYSKRKVTEDLNGDVNEGASYDQNRFGFSVSDNSSLIFSVVYRW